VVHCADLSLRGRGKRIFPDGANIAAIASVSSRLAFLASELAASFISGARQRHRAGAPSPTTIPPLRIPRCSRDEAGLVDLVADPVLQNSEAASFGGLRGSEKFALDYFF
jgi:hypothetical protein